MHARKVSAATIRTLYPEPKCSASTGGPTYCVGGALQRYRGERHVLYYPNDTSLAMSLQETNPNLSYEESLRFADKIITENDAHNFEAAWKALDDALGAD